MLKFRALLFVLFSYSVCFAQIDSIQQRIFLVGDAGELRGEGQPVIDWLKRNVNWNDEKNVAIFLGDNIYPLGMPLQGDPSYVDAKKIIDYQLGLVKDKKAKAFFVPGNHDWGNGKLDGWQRVINQVDYINGLAQKNIQALPTGGCPGPVAVDLSEKVVVVFIDTQWFLYVHDKPGPGSNCTSRTMDEFATELKEIVASHPNQLMIIASHHPLHTYGAHGGDFTLKDHIFPFTALNPNLYIPLPVIGSIYPIARGVFGSLQDSRHPFYQQMANTIEQIVREHPNPLPIGGHDHNLQFILKDTVPFIVSGSGININKFKRNPPKSLKFADAENGFVMLEIRKSGKVRANFYNINSINLEAPIFTQELKKIDTLPTKISKDSIPNLPDSIIVAANPNFFGGSFKHAWLGKNYRSEWATPVSVPVLDLGKEQGGLTPEKFGGGKHAPLLSLVDINGKEWAIRTLEKYPDAALPPDLRQASAHDHMEDGISASYPYAGLSVWPMQTALGLPVLRRKVVYIPDDPRLGRFRSMFKNKLAMIEEREPDSIKQTLTTEDLVLRLEQDNDRFVDQEQVLTARLLDNFYMDFDRHEGQWRWGVRDTGRGKVYFAIPRDPEQAFFVNEGIIPTLQKIARLAPPLQGFKSDAYNINSFNNEAANFDRYFLNGLDEQAWRRQIDIFLAKMTDDLLAKALKQQPPEIRNQHAEEIAYKLKSRKQYFKDEMMEYYRFISKQVNITGTNQRELFTITKNNDGKVQVVVNKMGPSNRAAAKIYDRVFDPEVTKELQIYGLEGADSFLVRGGNSPIIIRIIGGSGDDAFNNEGTGGNIKLYDVTYEQNKFYGSDAGVVKHVSNDARVNQYNRIFYKPNTFAPGISAAYNVDDGLLLGINARWITNGFRLEPYATQQYLNIKYAVQTQSPHFFYQGDFVRLLGNSDLVLRADVRAPKNVTNFFGYGNNTEIDRSQPLGDQYYKAQYDISNISVLLRRQLQSWMRVSIGPTAQLFNIEQNENIGKFVANTAASGLTASSFDRKFYGGLQALLDINSRNNQVLPSRGFLLDAGARSLFGLSNASGNVTQLHWDMSVLASFKPDPKVVYAFRLGVGTNFGDFEMPQAQYLSGTENLRGFRQNRFAGRTAFYQNTEIRVKLLDFTTYLFPSAIGVHVFNDIGKVWMRNEESARWHDGFGAGIWLSPIKRFVITGSIAHSKEEKAMPYFTFGFHF